MDIQKNTIFFGRYFFLKKTSGERNLKDLTVCTINPDEYKQCGLGEKSQQRDMSSVRTVRLKDTVPFRRILQMLSLKSRGLALTEHQVCELFSVGDFIVWLSHINSDVVLFLRGASGLCTLTLKHKDVVRGTLQPCTSNTLYKPSVLLVPFHR